MSPRGWVCEHARVDEPPPATETAVIVPVPAAERVVGPHRRVLDHSALWGVPAHVTVLYPFLPPDRVTANTIDDLRACLAEVDAFECTFARVRWFEQDVVWLAPEPDGPFRALTEAVWRRFPDHPPYRGAHPDVVPHLTVGSTRLGDLAGLRRAAIDVLTTVSDDRSASSAKLPIRARVDQVHLIAGTDAPRSWRTVAEFALLSRH